MIEANESIKDFNLKYPDASSALDDLIAYHNRRVKELKDKHHTAITKVLNELEEEKKIVNYYADNGYSVAIKRVKARTPCN